MMDVRHDHLALIVTALSLLVVSVLWTWLASRFVRAVRIDDQFIRLAGAGKGFLTTLPEWNGK